MPREAVCQGLLHCSGSWRGFLASVGVPILYVFSFPFGSSPLLSALACHPHPRLLPQPGLCSSLAPSPHPPHSCPALPLALPVSCPLSSCSIPVLFCLLTPPVPPPQGFPETFSLAL